jgi:hypothetical protein
MSVTEESILSGFLLPPAYLSEGLTLEKFTELFPQSKQSSASIPALYRELQRQRVRDIEDVKRNIAAEVQRGDKQKREVKRSRRAWHEADLEGFDERDVQMETDVRVPLPFVLCWSTETDRIPPSSLINRAPKRSLAGRTLSNPFSQKWRRHALISLRRSVQWRRK